MIYDLGFIFFNLFSKYVPSLAIYISLFLRIYYATAPNFLSDQNAQQVFWAFIYEGKLS